MFATYYIQVLSLGLVWTFFHCSGMCGPLVAGLTSRSDDPDQRLRRVVLRARRVLAYQSGRAFTYALLGASAGIAGAMFQESITRIAALSGFVVAPLIALLGVWKLSGRTMQSALGAKIGARLSRWMSALRRSPAGRNQFVGAFLTGLVLGLLPCVLMFWTLGVAATTASPLHGAGVMVTLVVLTTPTLLVAGCAAGIWRVRWSEKIVGVVLLISAGWMLLVALAANGLIAHAELTFRLFDEPYMVMFF